MRHFISAVAILGLLGTAAAAQPVTTTVRLSQQVMAGGQPLAPGTYQMRITDERPTDPSGQPNDSQRWVEFLSKGTVVARDVAEVSDATAGVVGTSSASANPRAVVQTLKGGEYVRVAVNSNGARYLVHLPTASLAGPTYPETPSRIPAADPIPANPGASGSSTLSLP